MVSRQIDLNRDEFDAWVQQVLKPRVLERRIRPQVFTRTMAHAMFLPEVLDRQADQKEFGLQIWEYLEIAVSDERARNGRQMIRKYRNIFNRIEQAFGVESETVAAIWGLETGYGVIRGDVPVISALATLAFRGRRAAFFEDELVAALRIVQSGICKPEEMVGSWAGAIGHSQFMPSSILDFAVDLDGDGKSSLCADDPADALASIANYFKKHGWKKGQPWGFEVRLPESFDFALTGRDQPLTSGEWAALGVCAIDGGPLPDYGSGAILLPAGACGVALLVLRNFHVITSYNKSDAYAVAIGHLSDRIVGGRSFRGNWPLSDPALSRGDITEAQFLLTQAGFDTYGIDGFLGPDTTRALRRFQIARGSVADGYLNKDTLVQLRGPG